MLDILAIVCILLTAVIMMIGAIRVKDTDVESSVRVLKIASIPAVVSVLLLWIKALI